MTELEQLKQRTMNKIFPEIDFTPEQSPLRRSIWIIFICAASILLFMLGTSALQGSEGNMAESIRELSVGKDIFAPENWHQEAEKMPLWFSRWRGLAAAFFGSSEFSCRLFSAVAALFCLGGTMLLAQEFFERRAMCCTAWLLIGSYGFIYWGRHVSTFMTLTAWVIWCAVFLYRERMNFLNRAVICFMLFAGSLWWGLNFILLIPSLFCITFERSRKFFTHWQTAAALPAGAVVLLLLSAWQTGFAGVPFAAYPARIWQQISGTFLESWYEFMPSPSDRWYPVPGNLPRLLLPWTLPAAVVIAGMFREWKKLPSSSKFLLTGTLAMIIFTGFFPGRRWQYQLPMLPFCLIITGAGIAGCTGNEAWHQRANFLMKWFFAVMCSFCLCAVITWPLWNTIFQVSPPLWIMFGMPLLGCAGLAALIFDTGRSSAVENVSGMNGSWSGYILAGVCFMAALLSVALPSLTRYRSGKTFWQKCGKTAIALPSGEMIFYGSLPDPKARFYMALPYTCTATARDELLEYLNKAKVPQLLIVVRREKVAEINELLKESQWVLETSTPLAAETSLTDLAEKQGDKYLLLQLRRRDSRY